MTRIIQYLIPLALVFFTSTARGQDAISIEIHASASTDDGPPRLVFHARSDAKKLDVSVRCGSIQATHNGPLPAGSSVEIPLRAPEGTWPCTGRVLLELTDGGVGEMPLNFEIHVLSPLKISVDSASADLVKGHLELEVNRDVRSFVVEAFGMDGLPIEAASRFIGAVPANQRVPIEWSPETHDVLRFRVRVEDGAGFWASKELYPWFVEVPHDDVVFATNESVVRNREVPKLENAWTELGTLAERYSAIAPVKLFIAGYTDTVGTRASNQALSEQRALALARWFQARGFPGEIWYQGFGEDGQAVQTADEVDQESNRRALYIVAADPPPPTRAMPRTRWKKLD